MQKTSTTIILKGIGHWWFTHLVTDLLPHLIGRIQWLCPQVSELWPSPPLGYLIWGQIGVLLFGKNCQLLPQIAFVVEFGSRVLSLSSWVPMCPWHFWLLLSHSHFMSRFSSCLPSLLTYSKLKSSTTESSIFFSSVPCSTQCIMVCLPDWAITYTINWDDYYFIDVISL